MLVGVGSHISESVSLLKGIWDGQLGARGPCASLSVTTDREQDGILSSLDTPCSLEESQKALFLR